MASIASPPTPTSLDAQGNAPPPITEPYALFVCSIVEIDEQGRHWTNAGWAKDLAFHLDYLSDLTLVSPARKLKETSEDLVPLDQPPFDVLKFIDLPCPEGRWEALEQPPGTRDLAALPSRFAIKSREEFSIFASFIGAAPMPRPGNPSARSKARMAADIKAKEEERCTRYRVFKAIDDAYRKGDIDALLVALGDPADFPNSLQPWDLGLGDLPLEYAIYWSPLAFIETLLDLGANPNYLDEADFPH